jgi:flagellar protein FlaJ
VEATIENFQDIREDIQRANLGYTLEEYLSITYFTAFITFFIETVVFSFVFGLMGFSPIAAMLLSITLAMIISGILVFIFYTYPSTNAKSRETKIKRVLPFAASYMATISSAKAPPIVLFKTLSQFKEYSEVAEESKNIIRDIDVFGLTFSEAVKRQAKRTPSKELRELLWGMNSVMTSGGDMTIYLKQKSDQLMNDYRRRIRKYAQDLTLYTEIYLTLIITGSIFFIVLSSIISSMSGGLESTNMQSFIVFILLPILSIGFILLIKTISPSE